MIPFDPELQLIDTKPAIKNKLKGLLNELKKFKVQTVLVLDYTTRLDFVGDLAFKSEAFKTLMKHLNLCIKAL